MAVEMMRTFQPAAVVGFGGYVTGPGGVAAKLAGVPVVIHEQNAVLGRVNRFLAKKAAAIVTAYARVERMPDVCEDKVHVLGNPVRAEVLALFPELGVDATSFPAARLSLKAHEARVLILG